MEKNDRRRIRLYAKREEVSRILYGLYGPVYKTSPVLRLEFEPKQIERTRFYI